MATLPQTLIEAKLFDELSPDQRADVLAAAVPHQLRRGQVLERQGDAAERFYLVEIGALKLTQVTTDGREVLVRFVGPGRPFAGVAALKASEYPVTAQAVEPTRVWQWRRETLRALVARYPQLKTNLLEMLADHMTEALTRVRELASERVGQRIARTLLRLADQTGLPSRDGVLLQVPLTRQDLAAMSGTTLYTVSRTLSRWSSQGIIGTAGRKILIRSIPRLTRLTEEDR